ncbi:MAG: hypothetical protein OXF08_07415 [Bacteroidetes bacterium]|nr:hypothetical protein [Bacteroidota bacterium]
MIRRILLTALFTCAFTVQAQTLVPSPGILANNITNLGASGESIWAGPYLNVSHDGGITWQAANVESLRGFDNSVYSLSVKDQSIWVGIGNQYTSTTDNNGSQTINEPRGLLFSSDGGNSWLLRTTAPPSDNDPETTGLIDNPNDTLITYGSVRLSALAVTVLPQSPPWDIDHDPDSGTVWVAGQLAGIRRSRDMGQTWERIILPPDTTSYLAPELGYDFPFFVQPVGIPEALFEGLNFQAFSVLVDLEGTVWVGTAGGLNRSEDGGIRWHHYTSEEGLLGNWVVSIEQQDRGSLRPAIWATNWPGRGRNQRYGISVTRDGGQTFQTALHGEQCYDFAFDGPRIYIVCARGLYRSNDDGVTFFVQNNFVDRNNPSRSSREGASVYSVAVTDNAVWIGSQDGLFKSTDQGNSWEIFRTEIPLDPSGLASIIPADRVPQVSTYAYPNPFSPSSDRLIRIRYDLENSQEVTLRIYDFGMTVVREIMSISGLIGANEIPWDGTDDRGLKLANGPYFYAVQTDGELFWGKILIVD